VHAERDSAVWLTRKHPGSLMVDANGRRMKYGGRQHGDWSRRCIESTEESGYGVA